MRNLEYVICDKCNGSGKDKFFIMEDYTGKAINGVCDKCNGEGKLNWIEKVFGKQKRNEGDIYYRNGNNLSKLKISTSNEKLVINIDGRMEWK